MSNQELPQINIIPKIFEAHQEIWQLLLKIEEVIELKYYGYLVLNDIWTVVSYFEGFGYDQVFHDPCYESLLLSHKISPAEIKAMSPEKAQVATQSNEIRSMMIAALQDKFVSLEG